MSTAVWVTGAALIALAIIVVVSLFRHEVQAGEIRLVTWLQGTSRIYRGPARSKELPLLTAGTTIPNTLVNVELDLSDQTADTDAAGVPRPVTVHIRATAMVSVGDSELMILKAATHFCTMAPADRAKALQDLLSGVGREALARLKHDELFAARPPVAEDGSVFDALSKHPFVAMAEQLSARELANLGMVLRSLTILSMQSDIAEARQRLTAAEAEADAVVGSALQGRRGREAQLEAERVISEKERELEQTRANNAGLIAQATAQQQEIKAKADAQRVRIEAEAAKEALRGAQFGLALDEALRITKIAAAQAEGFRKVNDTIREGSDSYFRYRLIEMLPQLTPAIAQALGNANLVPPAGGPPPDGATNAATSGITSAFQAMLDAHLMSGAELVSPPPGNGTPAVADIPGKVTVRRRPRGQAEV